jgi:GNAT superfamily N-acetyltransferase
MATTDTVTIRLAREHEVPLVLGFVRELAEYERLSHEMVATEEDMRKALFGPRPYAEVIFACLDGEPVGFALFCYNFSTFLAKPGIHLEDLYVRTSCRGRGIGQRLLGWLARETIKRDCGRLEWAVLDWNEPSIKFYDSLGARAMKEWFTYRLTGDALEKVAGKG